MSGANCRNWFGGDLVIEDINGNRLRYHDLPYSMAVEKVKSIAAGGSPGEIRRALYFPYPTDLKAHLLED